MRFAITVHGAPYTPASTSAFRFAEAALAAGHEIHRVFFYHEAVGLANALMVPPQDEWNLQTKWAELQKNHHFELAICIAAALRRGVLNEEENARYDQLGANAHPSFEVVGLGQLAEAIAVADRSITFGAA